MIYLVVTPERHIKTRRIMDALRSGIQDQTVVVTSRLLPNDNTPFVVWGQRWLAGEIIPYAYRHGRPFWSVDNGFWKPARGGAVGYYRFCYRGVVPIVLKDPEQSRGKLVPKHRWRKGGRNVIIGLPGRDFGRTCGFNMQPWIDQIEHRVRAATTRPIIVRPKESDVPLAYHLADAHCLVTHSSNVAVDAVLAGVPVFCEPSCPAAPVGRTDLDIENPVYPEREQWMASLMAQQFTLAEMASGLAWYWMKHIAAQVDEERKHGKETEGTKVRDREAIRSTEEKARRTAR